MFECSFDLIGFTVCKTHNFFSFWIGSIEGAPCGSDPFENKCLFNISFDWKRGTVGLDLFWITLIDQYKGE